MMANATRAARKEAAVREPPARMYRTIQRFLKRLPLHFVQNEPTTVRQGLRRRRHARIQQKHADILVADVRGFL
jgi:hypothetical protein